MSEHQNHRGKREAPGGEFPLFLWWRQHRAWVAGLDRGAKVKYRLFQALVVVAVLIIALALFLQAWVKLPEVPDLPGASLNPGTPPRASRESRGISPLTAPSCQMWPKADGRTAITPFCCAVRTWSAARQIP